MASGNRVLGGVSRSGDQSALCAKGATVLTCPLVQQLGGGAHMSRTLADSPHPCTRAPGILLSVHSTSAACSIHVVDR